MLVPSSVVASDLTFDVDAVKAHCAKEWTGDFAMQEFCVDQIAAGFAEFSGQIESETDDAMLAALAKCSDDWGVEWNMSAFCGAQQITGRDKIPTILSELPSEVQEIIRSGCEADWPNDFAMTAFCTEQNADAWRRINN